MRNEWPTAPFIGEAGRSAQDLWSRNVANGSVASNGLGKVGPHQECAIWAPSQKHVTMATGMSYGTAERGQCQNAPNFLSPCPSRQTQRWLSFRHEAPADPFRVDVMDQSVAGGNA